MELPFAEPFAEYWPMRRRLDANSAFWAFCLDKNRGCYNCQTHYTETNSTCRVKFEDGVDEDHE